MLRTTVQDFKECSISWLDRWLCECLLYNYFLKYVYKFDVLLQMLYFMIFLLIAIKEVASWLVEKVRVWKLEIHDSSSLSVLTSCMLWVQYIYMYVYVECCNTIFCKAWKCFINYKLVCKCYPPYYCRVTTYTSI